MPIFAVSGPISDIFGILGLLGFLDQSTPEDRIIIEKTSLSIEGHVNGQNTCPKPQKYGVKAPKTKTTTPTGALRAPVGRGRRPRLVVVFVFGFFR